MLDILAVLITVFLGLSGLCFIAVGAAAMLGWDSVVEWLVYGGLLFCFMTLIMIIVIAVI